MPQFTKSVKSGLKTAFRMASFALYGILPGSTAQEGWTVADNLIKRHELNKQIRALKK